MSQFNCCQSGCFSLLDAKQTSDRIILLIPHDICVFVCILASPISFCFGLYCLVCDFYIFLLQINGFEFAFMSLFSWENDFRSPSLFSYSFQPVPLFLCVCIILHPVICLEQILPVISYESLPCFRIPESFPHLHDKVLEAAADATIDLSPAQRKEEVDIQALCLCFYIECGILCLISTVTGHCPWDFRWDY